eukprot:s2619_g2.t1
MIFQEAHPILDLELFGPRAQTWPLQPVHLGHLLICCPYPSFEKKIPLMMMLSAESGAEIIRGYFRRSGFDLCFTAPPAARPNRGSGPHTES